MEHEKFKEILRGFSVTTITPFSSDLSQVDVDGISTNIEFLRKNDVPLIIPNGNTGEFYSLSEDEWKLVLVSTLDAVGERATLMPGVGHSIKTALAQVDVARELGIPAVMIMYPKHVFVSEEGLFDYYRTILDAARDLSVVLYKRGPLLTDDLLHNLLTHSNFVGVKYAFGRIVDFARSVQKLGNGIVWSCGSAERFAPFYFLAGAEAFTSGLCNFAPQITKKMFDAFKKKDFAEAMRIQRMITPFEDLREGRGSSNNVPVVKAAMDHNELRGGRCRPPIHSLSSRERLATISVISEWK
ncbi:MAG: dihydrodipicolinate synthase family protein [Candidatus Thorarchaeota archaeon]|nr:dihydrodipicolinate synthase family protein [Candidatus Thorarchaeota archaeon]